MAKGMFLVTLFMLFAFLLAPTARTDVIYDSQGFEDPPFVLGLLDGQDGWVAAGTNGGMEPMVVGAPDPVQGSQAIRLEVPDLETSYSSIQMSIPDLIAAGYDKVTVTFDIYRETDTWVSNVWWWWFDAGTPTYGIQWDEANGQYGATYPFGWDGTSVANELDRYVTLYMEWDFREGMAYGYYDGSLVTTVPISGIDSLTGWTIELGHDEATGSGPDVAWIDNFKIEAFIGDPAPDIKIDGDDGPLIFPSTQAVSMTISLDAGNQMGVNKDWWVLARLNGAVFYSWALPGQWQPGLKRAYGGPLFDITDYVIHSGMIPVGSWEFGFVIDAFDGVPQFTYYDVVQATVY